jgi:hypothetical protein
MPWHRLSAFIVFLSLAVSPAVAAERLDAQRTNALLFQGPWRIEAGASFDYFLWKPDRTLCVKLFDPRDSACHDTGSWFRNQTIVCYQLTWWGGTAGQRYGCFQIVEAGPGLYEALDAGGFPRLEFTVVHAL